MRLSLLPKKSFFFTQFDKHATNSLEAAVALERLLSDFTEVERKVRDIHTYENEGDQVFRDAVGDLFANVSDPIEIIKWKDIHSLIEVAIDRCEDVANIVEMIVIKHS